MQNLIASILTAQGELSECYCDVPCDVSFSLKCSSLLPSGRNKKLSWLIGVLQWDNKVMLIKKQLCYELSHIDSSLVASGGLSRKIRQELDA